MKQTADAITTLGSEPSIDNVTLKSNRVNLLRSLSHFFEDTVDPDRGHIVILCAEPYMDAAGILGVLSQRAKDHDIAAFYVDFNESQLVDPIIELGRTCRHAIASASGNGSLVCLSGLPKCDDPDIPRLIRPLTAMACHNCLVVVSLAPEDMYLVDGLRGCRVCRSLDLMALLWPSSSKKQQDLYMATHGIPSLVSCYRHDARLRSESPASNIDYVTALSYCVRTFLRNSLMNEERKVRYAAILIGRGTYSDLVELAGSKSAELVEQSSIDSPMFGINPDDKTFCCVGLASCTGLNAVYRIVAELADQYSQLVVAACKVLLHRGDAARAALICLMMRDVDERKCLVIAYASYFFDAGEFSLLRNAVSDPPLAAYNDPRALENARNLCESIDESRLDVAENKREQIISFENVAMSLLPGLLALRFREILSGEELSQPVILPHGIDGPLNVASAAIEASRLFISGDVRNSYSMLLDCAIAVDKDSPSIVSGSIAILYATVATLLGVSLSLAEQRWLFDTRTYFETLGIGTGKAACDAVVELIALAAGGAIDTERIDNFSRKAERLGLRVVHAYCRMAEAVTDLRAGTAVRAYVRLKGLVEEALSTNMPLLAAQAQILLTATVICMGDKSSNVDYGVEVPEISDLAPINNMVKRIAFEDTGDARILFGSGHDNMPSMPNLGGPLPAHSLWLADVLSKDCGEFSRSFQDLLPNAWRRALEQLSSVRVPEYEDNETQDVISSYGTQDAAETVGPEGLRIEIFLLGRFAVKVNGREMDTRPLERRRAKSLLSLLALVPGHNLKRYAIIESVWPELDYESGIHRVYEATSVLRHKLVGKDGSKIPRPLLSNRMDHSMTLNPECVWVDVDHFVGLVQRVLDSEGNDRLVVALCRQAEGFYRGDLVIPPNDGLGVANKRRDQVRGLFADAMVAGSNAATRLGLRLTAARFARKAYAADNEREDAIMCLARALVATGRSLEAEREYREFAVRVVEKGHRPPSRELRKFMRELLESPDNPLENDKKGGLGRG